MKTLLDLIKPVSKNKMGRIIFFTFEIIALAVLVLDIIFAVYSAIAWESFMQFLSGLLEALIYSSIVYGMGRVIDLLSTRVIDSLGAENDKVNNNDKTE